MVIGLLTLDLHFPGARSLKDKRQALRSLETSIRNRFNVSMAEVEHQDLWQRARVAVVTVNTDHGHLESTLQRVTSEAENAREILVARRAHGDPDMSRRTERLGEEIREEMARMIGGQLKDPRIGFVTVTRVEIGTDLRNARIYVGVLGSEADREKTLTGLRQAAGFMRRSLGQRLRLRHTPELTFNYDEGLEAHDRMARLLAEVHATRATPPDAAAAARRRRGLAAGVRRGRDARRAGRGQAGGPHVPRRGGPRAPRAAASRRAGHTGTLDPFATGVLPVCVGKATRLARFLAGATRSTARPSASASPPPPTT